MSTKVALVTGCSNGGIGSYICKSLASMGVRVYATARRAPAMSDLEGTPNIVGTLAMDVTDEESVKKTVEEILAREGRIDVLVNNAGVSATGTVVETEVELAREVFDANVFGMLRVVRAVAPGMIERGTGIVVNVGSVVGLVALPLSGAYNASKAALHSYSDALRVEMKPFGVRVVVVAPGAIKSNIASNNVSGMRTVESKYFNKDVIYNRANASQRDSTPTEAFASHVTKMFMDENCPNYVIYGKTSSLFKVFYHFPSRIIDIILARRFNVNSSTALLPPAESAQGSRTD